MQPEETTANPGERRAPAFVVCPICGLRVLGSERTASKRLRKHLKRAHG